MTRSRVEYGQPRGVRKHSTRGLTQAIDLTDWRAAMQSTEPENWKPIVGYEGYYEISDAGAVRSLNRLDSLGRRLVGKPMRTHSMKHGHQQVTLTRGSVQVKRTVHTLVLEAFVGPRPVGMEGCHNNVEPQDNRLSNLRWDTHRENVRDIVRHGRHELVNRTHCLRGHILADPNLTPAKLAKGVRACHACELARAHAHTRQIPVSADIADEFYREIMTGTYRPRRGVQR